MDTIHKAKTECRGNCQEVTTVADEHHDLLLGIWNRNTKNLVELGDIGRFQASVTGEKKKDIIHQRNMNLRERQ
jgi:hypothetical protein